MNWRFLIEYFYWSILERFFFLFRKIKSNAPQKDIKLSLAPTRFTHKSTLFRSHSWLVNSNQQFHIFLRGIRLYFYQLTMMLFSEVFDKVYQLVLFQAFWFARRESNQILSIEFAYFWNQEKKLILLQGSNPGPREIYWPYNSVNLFSVSSSFILLPVLMIKWISITKCSITGCPAFRIMTVAHHKSKSKNLSFALILFSPPNYQFFPFYFLQNRISAYFPNYRNRSYSALLHFRM